MQVFLSTTVSPNMSPADSMRISQIDNSHLTLPVSSALFTAPPQRQSHPLDQTSVAVRPQFDEYKLIFRMRPKHHQLSFYSNQTANTTTDALGNVNIQPSSSATQSTEIVLSDRSSGATRPEDNFEDGWDAVQPATRVRSATFPFPAVKRNLKSLAYSRAFLYFPIAIGVLYLVALLSLTFTPFLFGFPLFILCTACCVCVLLVSIVHAEWSLLLLLFRQFFFLYLLLNLLLFACVAITLDIMSLAQQQETYGWPRDSTSVGMEIVQIIVSYLIVVMAFLWVLLFDSLTHIVSLKIRRGCMVIGIFAFLFYFLEDRVSTAFIMVNINLEIYQTTLLSIMHTAQWNMALLFVRFLIKMIQTPKDLTLLVSTTYIIETAYVFPKNPTSTGHTRIHSTQRVLSDEKSQNEHNAAPSPTDTERPAPHHSPSESDATSADATHPSSPSLRPISYSTVMLPNPQHSVQPSFVVEISSISPVPQPSLRRLDSLVEDLDSDAKTEMKREHNALQQLMPGASFSEILQTKSANTPDNLSLPSIVNSLAVVPNPRLTPTASVEAAAPATATSTLALFASSGMSPDLSMTPLLQSVRFAKYCLTPATLPRSRALHVVFAVIIIYLLNHWLGPVMPFPLYFLITILVFLSCITLLLYLATAANKALVRMLLRRFPFYWVLINLALWSIGVLYSEFGSSICYVSDSQEDNVGPPGSGPIDGACVISELFKMASVWLFFLFIMCLDCLPTLPRAFKVCIVAVGFVVPLSIFINNSLGHGYEPAVINFFLFRTDGKQLADGSMVNVTLFLIKAFVKCCTRPKETILIEEGFLVRNRK